VNSLRCDVKDIPTTLPHSPFGWRKPRSAELRTSRGHVPFLQGRIDLRHRAGVDRDVDGIGRCVRRQNAGASCTNNLKT
jgi:hypothetical protein